MIELKIEYPLAEFNKFNLSTKQSDIQFYVLDSENEEYESYEIDSGGFVYSHKLDENANIIGVTKIDNLTANIFVYFTAQGEEEDRVVFYKLTVVKGQVIESSLENETKFPSGIRENMQNKIREKIQWQSTKKYKYLYRPYSIIVRIIGQCISIPIYFTSFYILKCIDIIIRKLTPHG